MFKDHFSQTAKQEPLPAQPTRLNEAQLGAVAGEGRGASFSGSDGEAGHNSRFAGIPDNVIFEICNEPSSRP